jgi:hypothetical protein
MPKDDEQILFPRVEVDGIEIRPWTLGQAVELADTLGAIVDIVGAGGVGGILSEILDSIDPENTKVGDIGRVFMGGWKNVARSLPAMLPKFIPLAPRILSVSLSLPVEEVAKFDLGKTGDLLKTVAALNWEYLKNYYGPGKAGREEKVA